MGCDIHVFLEYREVDDKREEPFWDCFLTSPAHLSRNYQLFGYLTNGEVRSDAELKYGISPRGLPPNLSFFAKDHLDENKEYHNFSWLNYDEFKMIINQYKKDGFNDILPIDYKIFLKMMKFLEKNRYKTRIVFFFDS
jgi:hypothetical protein